MIGVLRKKIWGVAAVASLLFAFATSAPAQAPTASVHGQVTDPSGGAVAGATVLLTAPDGQSKGATSGKDGSFEVKDLVPGTYKLEVFAKGFAVFTKTDLAVTAGQAARVNVPLSLEVQQEKVVVTDQTTQVDTNPANNANTLVVQGKDLDALSDDPDELQSQLQALAGPSAGPNGGQIYIDGFTGGQLPPKASIREIRLNQNPSSSEYDKLGYGRVEIFTKPGTDKLHGQFTVIGNSSAFNSRNPFEVLPEGTEPPSYHTMQYSGNIGGALGKKASYFFNIEQRDIQDLSIVSATVLGPAPDFAIQPYSAAIPNPQNRTNLSPRLDYQLTPTNTLTARYQFYRNTSDAEGIGQFNLEEVGTNVYGSENTIQVSDTQTVNAHTINETRFQWVRSLNQTSPVAAGVYVSVAGAFNGNGSGSDLYSDIQNRYEVQNTTYMNYGKHAWKFGGRLRVTNDGNSATSNFLGQFTFGARLLPGCTPTDTDNCQITPIQAYQITEQGLSQGLTIPQIQALGGGASYYLQTAGVPLQTVNWVDGGLFVQDDWKVRQNITVSYGLRFETQNDFSDHADWAPRIGIAWALDGNAKKPPKTVLRAGFGMFYDRFAASQVLQQERLNGVNQIQYQIINPNFYLTGNPECIPPLSNPPPAACGVGTSNTASVVYQTNPNLHSPYTIQTGLTLERQLTKYANIAVTYLNSRGVHQFNTNNLNPADPETGLRPDPTEGNIFQYQSQGIFKQNQLIVNGRINMGTRLSLFGYYTLNYSSGDTNGAGSFQSNPYDLQQDYGRTAYDVRNRVFLGGTIGLPRGFRVSPFLIASSGVPFNITTGADPYQDSTYNMRPAFGACPPDNATSFGCFNSDPAIGYTPIPIYYGQGDSRFSLNLRFSKTFGFGPVKEGSGGGAGGGMGGGTFGRPGGGPRGGGGFDSGSTNHKYALTFGVDVRNIFNNVNLATPIGNLSSPQFGEANGLAGPPFSDTTSNRRIRLQATFSF